MPCAVFQGFSSNPKYEDVLRGVEAFRAENCDAVVAVGGGSSLDVGKCIKLFARMDPEQDCLAQPLQENGVPLAAVPTTAGTGSESTHFAVVYVNGEKRSVASTAALPDLAILDADALDTLPLYQKKCTLLDALCQGIESAWSVRSTPGEPGPSPCARFAWSSPPWTAACTTSARPTRTCSAPPTSPARPSTRRRPPRATP